MERKYKEIVGIVGGFGAYATLGFYRRILEEFAGKSEREYPHIMMDNNFTMPSRTLALLYGEKYDEVVVLISDSLKKLCEGGCNHIILVCGTAHAFLEDCYKLVPEAKGKVLNIIEVLGEYLQTDDCKKALIIAAEGTLEKKIYENVIGENVDMINPGKSSYDEIRYFIESVKTNNITEETYIRWIAFLGKFETTNVILGCTEFPELVFALKKYDKHQQMDMYKYYDPLSVVINKLKKVIV